jgi:isopentenyldiphosphate isomerase
VLVFSTDGKVLLQRRSQHKDLFPGYWCASASGHVGQGETYDVTAVREVLEELGISVPVHSAGKTTVRSIYETEITALYTAHSDGPFHFHPTETDGGEYFDQERLASARRDSSLPMTPALIAAIDALLAGTE